MAGAGRRNRPRSTIPSIFPAGRGDNATKKLTRGTSSKKPYGVLSAADRRAIRAAVHALPPLTDEQVDGLSDVILNARIRGLDQRNNVNR